MRPNELVVRCYAERKGDQWVGYCVDFSLAAQGESLQEVKDKIDAQIREYVFDALAGEDRAHAEYLLSRKAPLRFRLKYWFVVAVCAVARAIAGKADVMQKGEPRIRRVKFAETVPLVPALC